MKFPTYHIGTVIMGNRGRKRNRSDVTRDKAELSDKDFRALQQTADKVNAQLAAVKKANQRSDEGQTRRRSSHGRRACGAFNYFGCNKGEECTFEHVDSREAMARYRDLIVERKWTAPTKIRGQIADWRRAEIVAAETPDIAKNLGPTIRASTLADVLSDNSHDPTMLPTYEENGQTSRGISKLKGRASRSRPSTNGTRIIKKGISPNCCP